MCPKCRWNQLSCPREPCRGLSSLPSPSLLPPLCSLPCHLPGSPSDLLQLLLCVPIFPAVPCTALPGSIPLAVLPALPPRGCPHLLGTLSHSSWQGKFSFGFLAALQMAAPSACADGSQGMGTHRCWGAVGQGGAQREQHIPLGAWGRVRSQTGDAAVHVSTQGNGSPAGGSLGLYG